MILASFDVGTRNLGCVITKIDNTAVAKVNRVFANASTDALSKQDQFNVYLSRIAASCKIQNVLLFDLAQTKNQKLTNTLYLKLFRWLDSLKMSMWNECDTVIIESQLARNFKACSVMHSLKDWFLITYGETKRMEIFPSRFKTIMMGAKTKVSVKGILKPATKAYRKSFCKALSKSLLENIDDVHQEEFFVKHKSKSDDICDCYIQGLAFVIINNVDN